MNNFIFKRKVNELETNPHLPGTPDEFIEKNMKLAQSIAWKYNKAIKSNPSGFSMDDVLSIAYIGLVKAYRDYDPEKATGENGGKIKFSTYAVPKIKGEIQRYLRDYNSTIKIGRPVKELLTKVYDTGLTGSESIQELIEKAELTKEEAEKVFEALKAQHPDSIDRPINEEDGARSLGEIIEDKNSNSDEQIIVSDFINGLKPELKQIYKLRIESGLSQLETAHVIGISQVQVSRREKQMIDKAKDYGKFKGGYPLKTKYTPEFKSRIKDIALNIGTVKEAYETIQNEFKDTQIPFTSFSVMYYNERKNNKKTEPKEDKSKVQIIKTEPKKQNWNSMFTIKRNKLTPESLADEIAAISLMIRSLNCSEIELSLEVRAQ